MTMILNHVTEQQIRRQLELADLLVETEGTVYPDDTFEEGVKAALLWILGEAVQPLGFEEEQRASH